MTVAAKYTALAAATLALGAMLAISGPASGGRHGRMADSVPPAAPADVHVVAATQSTVALVWNPSTDDTGVAGYLVDIDANRRKARFPAFIAKGLDCGQSVAVRVVAYDRAGNHSTPADTTVSTAACSDGAPPSAPVGFRQAATTQQSVVLEWSPSTDNVGVVSYGIFQNGLPFASSFAPNTTFSGLACETWYRYDVDAVDAAGNHSPRTSAWVRTADCSDNTAPSRPSRLSVASSSTTSITLAWSPSTDNVAVTGYRVSAPGVAQTTVTQPPAAVTNLSCGLTYQFAVDAFDAAGNRSAASSVTASTDACVEPPLPPTTPPPTTPPPTEPPPTEPPPTTPPPTEPPPTTPPPTEPPAGDTQPPTTPTGLGVSAATTSSLSVSWTASTDNVGVTGYGVYVAGTGPTPKTQTSATLTGLACGKSYTVDVDAHDAAGNRSGRASVVATTSPCPDTQAPSAPTGVTATSRTATSIALSWSSASDNVGVTGYGMYRGGTLVDSSIGTTGIWSGLTCGANYTLAVDSRDAAGNRSSKTTVMVATTACPDTQAPTTPTGLATSNVSPNGLTLSWNAASDNVGVTGYKVFRNSTAVATPSSTTTVQTGLACGTSYTYAVAAVDAAGNTSQQAQTSASTSACLPPPPPPPPPPPATSGDAIDGLEDLNFVFNPAHTMPAQFGGTGGGGMFAQSTPYGPGFRFVSTANMPAIWDANTKCVLAQAAPSRFWGQLGATEHWKFNLYFPGSQTWPSPWMAGVLWEWHTSSASGQHLAINDDGTFRIGRLTSKTGYSFTKGPAVRFNAWIPVEIDVKWSQGSDGFMRVSIDGTRYVDFSGPTDFNDGDRRLQFGYYALRQGTNEVHFGGITKS